MDDLTPTQVHQALAQATDASIERLEKALLAEDQVDPGLEHWVHGGLYVRRITVPAGGVITSRVHKYPHVFIVERGDYTLATPFGVERFQGPSVTEGTPGHKRAGYAHEETVLMTVHRVEHSDCDRLLGELTCATMAEYRAFQARCDYAALLESWGVTDDAVRECSEREDDVVGVPSEYAEAVYLGASPIEGVGVFARSAFEPGAHIGPAVMSGFRTELGRYINHSGTPNAVALMLDNGDVALVAARAIEAEEEITNDYAHNVAVAQGDL